MALGDGQIAAQLSTHRDEHPKLDRVKHVSQKVNGVSACLHHPCAQVEPLSRGL